ncbi:MAG: hypothetical protein K0R43_1859 [Pseudoduganella sp.]|jgi:hypothetical protein|nr:hypothetical protein [Pseudoduganella sp.]
MYSHPTKEQVRVYLAQRGHAHLPPPSPEEIRRRLDWRTDAEPMPAALMYLPPALFWITFTWLCLPFVPFSLARNDQK